MMSEVEGLGEMIFRNTEKTNDGSSKTYATREQLKKELDEIDQ
jgi:hypothetical protein